MILYPSVDALLERVDSRYSLILLASKRAHELDAGASPMLEESEYKSVKNVGRCAGKPGTPWQPRHGGRSSSQRRGR